jgi:hypothetical protein
MPIAVMRARGADGGEVGAIMRALSHEAGGRE